VVAGGPSEEALRKVIDPPVEGYVGNVGRVMHRFKRPEELAKLDEMIAAVSKALDAKREEIAKDPLSIVPSHLMDIIMDQVPEIHDVLSPTPITVQMAGLRVKLPFEIYADTVRDLEIEEGVKVRDVAEITPSRMRNYMLVRIKSFSETNVMV